MPEIKNEDQNEAIQKRLSEDVETRTDKAYEQAVQSVKADERVFPNNMDEPLQIKPSMQELIADAQKVEQPKVTKTRGPKAATKPVGKASAEDIIEKLRKQAENAINRIMLVEWVQDSTDMGDFPEKITKDGRDLLLGYMKEIENIKNNCLQKIQNL